MRILVLGAQHSCTRLFVGLFDIHPDVEVVGHASVPANGEVKSVLDIFPKYDHVCVVTRSPTAINLSNLTDYKIPIEQDIAAQAYSSIINDLKKAILEDKDFEKRLHFVSYETAQNIGEFYVKYLLSKMGLDPSKYPGLKDEYHTPKAEDGAKQWFTVHLQIEDVNKKYFMLPTPPEMTFWRGPL